MNVKTEVRLTINRKRLPINFNPRFFAVRKSSQYFVLSAFPNWILFLVFDCKRLMSCQRGWHLAFKFDEPHIIYALPWLGSSKTFEQSSVRTRMPTVKRLSIRASQSQSTAPYRFASENDGSQAVRSTCDHLFSYS